MTRYKEFDQLKDLMKLKETEKGYTKFIQTGLLGIHDYGRGFIDLEIYVYYRPDEGIHYVRLWFGTADDGDFGGWVKVGDEAKAHALAYIIAYEVFKDMVAFPTEKELNSILRKYGVHVGVEY